MNETQATTEVKHANIQPGTTVFERVDGRYVELYVVDLIAKPDDVDGHFGAVLSNGHERATVDADELAVAVADETSSEWVASMWDQEADEWIPHPRRADVDGDQGADVELRTAPDSPTELTFERVSGRGSRTEVNAFLEGSDDGLVSHELGGVSSWKAAFVARHDGAIVSAIVLHTYHPSKNGVELAITRIANHPSAPANTSTWVIARARNWAERAGYERLATYAGVGGNEGVCYQAAGFDAVGEPEQVEGKNWSGDSETWVKQKYAYELEPENYADWSEADATESVELEQVVDQADAGVATRAVA